jgi:hypothetical protein
MDLFQQPALNHAAASPIRAPAIVGERGLRFRLVGFISNELQFRTLGDT